VATVADGASGFAPGVEVASERIAEFLRDAILSGQIGPGDRIRQEDIAARLGASRIPVREALRILEAEGLTEHAANKGARVPVLDMHSVGVLYRMRERVEPIAIAESLPFVTDDDIEHLRDLQQRIESATDVGQFLVLDREFHLSTYSRCGQDTLTSIITRLWNSTQYYRRAFMTITGMGQRWIVHAEHNLLIDAVSRRDSQDAERYLEGHIRRTRIELARHPEVFAPLD
jgi:DNA-binding GntR family transcriptional regulator